MNSNDRSANRERHLARYDADESAAYAAQIGLGWLSPEEEQAYADDISSVFEFPPSPNILEVGAGTGALTRLLVKLPGANITALEPAEHMRAQLLSHSELQPIQVVNAICDSEEARSTFSESKFDVIISRQVTNCLSDPLVAFSNWRHWLKPTGTVLVIEGLYGRDGWRGTWQEDVDRLPLSAVQTTATIPYLMQHSGYIIVHTGHMEATNQFAPTPRYLVVAKKDEVDSPQKLAIPELGKST